MQRIGVLNGNSITYDHDISALVRGLTDWGVIEWGLISDNKVLAPIQAIVSAQRSNGQKLLLHFESDEQIQLPTSWSYKVYIEVDQSKIDDGQANAENGTGIATIKTGENLPSKNVLQIAKVTNGQIEQRTLIPKLQSLSTRTATLEEKVKTSETKVAKLEDKWTPQYLGKFVEVGEVYQAGDVMVEKWGKLVKKQKKISQAFTVPSSFNGYYFVGTINIPRGDKVIVDLRWRIFTSSWTFEKIRVLSNKKYSSMQDYKNNPWTVYATSYWDDWEVVEFIKNDDWPVYFSVMCSSQYGAYINNWSVDVEINNWIWSAPLYPREVKGVGERVECTIMGLHSNGDLIQPKPVEIVLGKEMSGTFTATREGPNSWYLEVSYRTGSSDSQYWWINIWEVGLNTSRDNRTERIFVQKWPIVLKGWGREGYAINTYLKLEKFTSVM